MTPEIKVKIQRHGTWNPLCGWPFVPNTGRIHSDLSIEWPLGMADGQPDGQMDSMNRVTKPNIVPGYGTDFTHYIDVIISTMASQITGVSIVCSTVGSGKDQRKHQISASLAFVREIHRWPVISLYKGTVTRKMFPFDDVITCFVIKGTQTNFNILTRWPSLWQQVMLNHFHDQRSLHMPCLGKTSKRITWSILVCNDMKKYRNVVIPHNIRPN